MSRRITVSLTLPQADALLSAAAALIAGGGEGDGCGTNLYALDRGRLAILEKMPAGWSDSDDPG